MTLGEKLAELRKEKNITQEQMAEELGVTRQTISKWELDQSKPDLQYIRDLSEFFQVTLDYLIKEEEKDTISKNTAAYEPTLEKQNINSYNAEKNTYKVLMILVAIYSAIYLADDTLLILKNLFGETTIFTMYQETGDFLGVIRFFVVHFIIFFTYIFSFYHLKKEKYNAVILCQIFVRVLYLMTPLDTFSSVPSTMIFALVDFITSGTVVILLFLLYSKKLKPSHALISISSVRLLYMIAVDIHTIFWGGFVIDGKWILYNYFIGYAPTIVFLCSLGIIVLNTSKSSYLKATTDQSTN